MNLYYGAHFKGFKLAVAKKLKKLVNSNVTYTKKSIFEHVQSLKMLRYEYIIN